MSNDEEIREINSLFAFAKYLLKAFKYLLYFVFGSK